MGFRCLNSILEFSSIKTCDRLQKSTLPEIDRNEFSFGRQAFFLLPFHERIRWQASGIISNLGCRCVYFSNVFSYIKKKERGVFAIHFAGNVGKQYRIQTSELLSYTLSRKNPVAPEWNPFKFRFQKF